MNARLRALAAVLVTCLTTSVGWANIPAAYFACEGAEEGVHCQLPGPVYGGAG